MRKRLISGVAAILAATIWVGGPTGFVAGEARAQSVVPVAPTGMAVHASDHVLGKADAPVTIIEYASLTCGHCGAFHTQILPELKKKYIDTGKVKLVFRDFPLDRAAAQGAMLAECAGNDRYFAVLDTLFSTQASWAVSKDPAADLGKLLRLGGMGEPEIKACLANEKLLESLLAERQGGEALGVTSTPTLFIGGEKHVGLKALADYDAAIAKLIK